jgi:hypothetical protein
MKQLDKLKHQRYVISMKIIALESRGKTVSKSEAITLSILRKKEAELDLKIENH